MVNPPGSVAASKPASLGILGRGKSHLELGAVVTRSSFQISRFVAEAAGKQVLLVVAKELRILNPKPKLPREQHPTGSTLGCCRVYLKGF